MLLKLYLVVMLVVDVVANLVLVKSCCADEVSFCPQWALREFLRFLLDPGGGFLLQDLHYVGDGVLGRNRDVEMDVLVADVPGKELQLHPHRDVDMRFSSSLMKVSASTFPRYFGHQTMWYSQTHVAWVWWYKRVAIVGEA